jgi:Ca2+-binding EF-hand superfamily protein
MSAKLTKAQEQELLNVFVMMDKNGSEGVEIKELNYLMCKLLGQEVDELTLSEILSELTDSDAPGRFISWTPSRITWARSLPTSA